MAENLDTKWLLDEDGNKFYPKTHADAVYVDENTTVKTKLEQAIYEETDPTVPAWAKSETKPTYTADEVGALPITGGIIAGDGIGLGGVIDGTTIPRGVVVSTTSLNSTYSLIQASADNNNWARIQIAQQNDALSGATVSFCNSVNGTINSYPIMHTGNVGQYAAPPYTYGTADLTAGSSALATGKLYFVYE